MKYFLKKPESRINKSGNAECVVVGANIIYGVSFLATSVAVRESGKAYFGVIGSRFAIAFVFFLCLIIFKVIKVSYLGKPVKYLVALSLLHPGIYYISETLSLDATNSSIVGVMIGLTPMVVALLGWVVFHKKQSRRQIIWIFLSVAGVIILNINGVIQGTINLKGIIFLSTALITLAIYNLVIHQLGQSFSSVEITFFMSFIGMVEFNLMDFIIRGPDKILATYRNAGYLCAVIFLGIFVSGIANMCLNYGLIKLPSMKVSVLNNITSVVSVICGILILGEKFTIAGAAGCLAIIAGSIGYSTEK